MKALYLYAVAFVFFWIGFLSSSMLSMGRDKHAATMGDMEREAERKHCQRRNKVQPAPAEAVTVSDILQEKKTGTKRVKAAENGTQKVHDRERRVT